LLVWLSAGGKRRNPCPDFVGTVPFCKGDVRRGGSKLACVGKGGGKAVTLDLVPFDKRGRSNAVGTVIHCQRGDRRRGDCSKCSNSKVTSVKLLFNCYVFCNKIFVTLVKLHFSCYILGTPNGGTTNEETANHWAGNERTINKETADGGTVNTRLSLRAKFRPHRNKAWQSISK
jgi:hypothetical protein